MVNLSKNEPIVRSDGPIALFGGGEICSGDVSLALSRVETVVAADGGAVSVIDSGRVPDAVIGDFDSLGAAHQASIPTERLFRIAEQDSTDFDKALRSIQTPLVLGVGFLGGRVDHQLAVFNALVRFQDRPCILLGQHEIVFHAPPVLELEMKPETVVSLYPLRGVTGRSRGLEWPIDEIEFRPDGRIGTSNRATGPMRLEMDGPGMLIMIPRGFLDQVMQAFLSDQSARWPVRGE